MVSVPTRVVIAGAVNNGRVVDVGAGVSRQVADVDHFGRRIVDIHVSDVIDRRCRRYRVNGVRDVCRDDPWPVCAVRDKPHSFVHRIVFIIKQHNGRRPSTDT